MSRTVRVWTVGVAVVVIVATGLLMLSQALVAHAAPTPPPLEFQNPQAISLDCTNCHAKQIEIHDVFGSGVEVCWTCHDNAYTQVNPQGGGHNPRTKLRLEDGTLLLLSDSTQLCAQCHQGRYDAWKERAPEIPGTVDIAKCTDCHNPHRLQAALLDIAEPHPTTTPSPTTTTTPPPTTTTLPPTTTTPPPTTTTPPPTTTTPPPTTTTPPLPTTTTPPPTTTTPPPTTTTPPPTTTTPPPTTTTTPPPTTTTPPPDDGESSLNIGVIIGAVLGVLVVGGVVYYFVRR